MSEQLKIEVGALVEDISRIRAIVTKVNENMVEINWFKWEPTIEPPQHTWEHSKFLVVIKSSSEVETLLMECAGAEVLKAARTVSVGKTREMQTIMWRQLRASAPRAYDRLYHMIRR